MVMLPNRAFEGSGKLVTPFLPIHVTVRLDDFTCVLYNILVLLNDYCAWHYEYVLASVPVELSLNY